MGQREGGTRVHWSRTPHLGSLTLRHHHTHSGITAAAALRQVGHVAEVWAWWRRGRDGEEGRRWRVGGCLGLGNIDIIVVSFVAGTYVGSEHVQRVHLEGVLPAAAAACLASAAASC